MTEATAIGLCAALVAAGIAAVVRLGGDVRAAPGDVARPPVVRLARSGVVLAAAGVLAGVLAAGAGGRLVMRILALTTDETPGTFTEGGALVGAITLGGTLSFITFVGILAGLASAVAYALIRPLLPRGRAGGVALGAILLVVVGPRVDPLRGDNVDFALLGPDWLAVLLFVALALFQGLLVVALAGRLSRGAAWAPARGVLAAGRLVLVLVVLGTLPALVGAVTEILDSAEPAGAAATGRR